MLTASRNPDVYRLRSNLMMRRLVCTEKLAASHRKCRCRQQMISYSRYLKVMDSNTIGEVMILLSTKNFGRKCCWICSFPSQKGRGTNQEMGSMENAFPLEPGA